MRELYQIFPSAFTDNQINKILEIVSNQSLLNASTFSYKVPSDNVRKSKICWLSENWIKNLLWEHILRVNNKSFKIDVENKSEVQFTEYSFADNGHYDWHHDVNWNGQTDIDRKISMTVQLSNENEYDGGDFEFEELETNANFKLKGTIIIFPSYLRHRVTPVTSGVRKSLVAWFSGPQWR
ncbi:2OG-Fe(II) oxygenase [Alphaproteobacteria bacterium]|nr:2OG-Fe(II) oxygenase [Alphaproteobacteria bacterium]